MQPLRVLVVDDVQDSADILVLLVKLWGYETAVAYDGLTAVEAARTWQPHVVLLDIGLPRVDGYEVARQLRLLPGMSKVLLVAITGHAKESDVQRCQEAAIDYHFRKPVEPVELQELLAKAKLRQSNSRG
jgi:CheY-like chemotaxis protein